MPAELEVRVPVRGGSPSPSLPLSVVRSFVTRQSHNVPALSSHARVDRIGKHILVCSSPLLSPRYPRSLIFVTVIVNASTRARMKLVSVPRDGIDRADRMDQGWKRVFEFEMEGYVLSLNLLLPRCVCCCCPCQIYLRSIVVWGKKVFFLP